MLRNFLIFFFNITFVFSQSLYDNLSFPEKKWVDSIYSSLTTEEKVAQLFVNWVSPEQSNFDEIKKLVEYYIERTSDCIEFAHSFENNFLYNFSNYILNRRY